MRRICEHGGDETVGYWEFCYREPNYLLLVGVALAVWIVIAVVTATMK